MKTILLLIFLLPCSADAFGWGKAVRFSGGVTPSVHFDPYSIVGSIVTSWYRADSGLNPSTPGSTITSWSDLSATANHLTGISGTPKVSTITQNGLPMVQCYGDTNRLYGSDAADVAQPFTVFIVAKPTDWTTNNYSVVLMMHDDTYFVRRLNDRTNLFSNTFQGPTVTNNVTQLWTMVVNGASSSIAINNGADTTGNAGTAASSSYPFVCNRAYLDMGFIGFIGEILIYKGSLSAGDLAIVKAGLNAWWDIY